MDLQAHLTRQIKFSEKTFGPGSRQKGVTDHIKKELVEVEEGGNDPKEWCDVAILALDGFWRSLREHHPDISDEGIAQIMCDHIVAKQNKNERRTWPDWRTMDPNKAIEHDRTGEEVPESPDGYSPEGVTWVPLMETGGPHLQAIYEMEGAVYAKVITRHRRRGSDEIWLEGLPPEKG